MSGALRWSERELEEARHKKRLSELVIESGTALRRAGAEFSGLCPFHGERSPSFRVYPDDHYYCFGCGARGDAIGFRMARFGETFVEAVQALLNEAASPPRSAPAEGQSAPSQQADDAKKKQRALVVWEGAEPIEGTLGARYLRHKRGIRIAPPPNLRFRRRCWHDFAERPYPAIVARVCDVAGAFLGVWRIYLDEATGDKIARDDARLGLGRVAGGSVWLSRVAPQCEADKFRIDIGEGVETCLSVLQRHPGLIDMRAGLSTSGLRGFVIPPGTRELVIWADRDKPDRREFLDHQDAKGKWVRRPNPNYGRRAGESAAHDLAARARRAGLGAAVMAPGVEGADFNDVYREELV